MATEDILINDGDGFISLSALAAEKVDAKLPIESVDNTVKLDSPSANTFTVSTGGFERVQVTDSASIFNVQVQTDKITSKSGASNNASIALGADLTLDNKSGTIWIGSSTNAPAGGTNLLVGSSDGDGKNLLIASGQPKTAAEGGSSISLATVEGNGDRSRRTRLYISPEGYVGVNDTALDEQLCVAGGIKANRFKGYGSNPQIVFESQQAFLNASDGSDYTPTQPNSIATKQTVDDKIWVGTTAQYNAIATKNPTTLYCLTD